MTQYMLKYKRGNRTVTELMPSTAKFRERRTEIKGQRRKILEESEVTLKVEKSVPILG